MRVERCTLYGGPLTKAHVGASEHGLVKFVAHMRGPEAAIAMLRVLSALANEYLRMRPLCMTGDDLVLEGAPDAFDDLPGASDEATVAARYEARVAAPIHEHVAGCSICCNLAGKVYALCVAAHRNQQHIRAAHHSLQLRAIYGACIDGIFSIIQH